MAILPAYKYIETITELLREKRITVVCGETGSGKSTVLPIQIAERLGYQVVCVQPRNVAARSLADFTNSGCWVGGYRYNGNNDVTYMTNGIYINVHSNFKHNCLVIDEVHERGIQCDIVLAYAKMRLETDPDFRVVVCSATFCVEDMLTYFNCTTDHFIHISGRLYKTDIIYSAPTKDEQLLGASVVSRISEAIDKGRMKVGNVLVFQSGVDEVERLATTIQRDLQSQFCHLRETYKVSVLHGQMEVEDQQRVLMENGLQIIVTTNIAETSLTVCNVTCVVDFGLEKIMTQSDLDITASSLRLVPISKASAIQRAGRAGRVRDGLCIRMYSEDEYERFETSRHPEILTTNISSTILSLRSQGINISTLPLLSPPNPETVKKNEDQLIWYGALDSHRNVTKVGRFLSSVNIAVPYAFALYRARELFDDDMVETIAVLVSFIAYGQSPFFSNRKRRAEGPDGVYEAMEGFRDDGCPESEHMMLINLFRYCQENKFDYQSLTEKKLFVKAVKSVNDIYKSICRTMKVVRGTKQYGWGDIFTCLYPSFPNKFIYTYMFNSYIEVGDHHLCSLHPGSMLGKQSFTMHGVKSDLLFYSQIRTTTRRYVSICSPIPTIEHGNINPDSLLYKTVGVIAKTLCDNPFHPSVRPHVLNYDMFMVLLASLPDHLRAKFDETPEYNSGSESGEENKPSDDFTE